MLEAGLSGDEAGRDDPMARRLRDPCPGACPDLPFQGQKRTCDDSSMEFNDNFSMECKKNCKRIKNH